MMTLLLEIKKSNKLSQSILRMEDQINSSIKNIVEKVKLGGKIFLCGNGGKIKKHCDISLIIKSKDSARVKECHIF